MHLRPEHLVGSTKGDDAHVLLALEVRPERAQSVVSQDLDLGVVLHQALTDARLVDRAVRLRLGHHLAILLFEAAVSGGRTHSSLKSERGVGDLPTVVHATDDVVLRATRIGEEHLAELGGAIRLNDSAHFDAWLLHRHEEI